MYVFTLSNELSVMQSDDCDDERLDVLDSDCNA